MNLTTCDAGIRRVLEASTIDGQGTLAWLESRQWRTTRKACLLNLMASLRSRPTRSDTLVDQVEQVFRVFNDRAYVKVDRQLLRRVEDLAKHPKKRPSAPPLSPLSMPSTGPLGAFRPGSSRPAHRPWRKT